MIEAFWGEDSFGVSRNKASTASMTQPLAKALPQQQTDMLLYAIPDGRWGNFFALLRYVVVFSLQPIENTNFYSVLRQQAHEQLIFIGYFLGSVIVYGCFIFTVC